jgi:hypothetical protein
VVRSGGSDHVRNGPDAPTSERRPYRDQGGFDGGFQFPAFQFVTALDFEKRFAVEEVRHHDVLNLRLQVVGGGDCEFGGVGDHGGMYGVSERGSMKGMSEEHHRSMPTVAPCQTSHPKHD